MGITLTAGFVGKFYLLTAGVGKGNWLLAVTIIVSSVIGLYYYQQFIFAMMRTDGNNAPIYTHPAYSSFLGLFTLRI